MDSASLTIFFDGAIVAIILISALLAFLRGFLSEIFGLIGLVIGLLVAYWAYINQGHLAAEYIEDPIFAAGAVAIGFFIVTWFLISLITHFFIRRVRKSAVGMVDRILGFAFGAARGALIVCAFFALYSTLIETEDEYPEFLQTAYTLPYLQSASAEIITWGQPIMTMIDTTLIKIGLPPLTGEEGILSGPDGDSAQTDGYNPGTSVTVDQNGLDSTIRAITGSTE